MAVHLCTAKHAWFAVEPTDRGERRHAKKKEIAFPLSDELWQELRDRVEQDRWVVECKSMEKLTLRESMPNDRNVPPNDAIEMFFESPEGVKLQVLEGGVGLVGGNTWCAITVRFSTDQSVSRLYYCKTEDGELGWIPPSGAPEIRAPNSTAP